MVDSMMISSVHEVLPNLGRTGQMHIKSQFCPKTMDRDAALTEGLKSVWYSQTCTLPR